MKFKKGVIIICLIICLFSIASVNASNVNDTVVTTDEQTNDLIEIENQDDVGVTEEDTLSASAGTFTDLANEIANANSELDLTRSYKFSDGDSNYKEGIIIDKKVTINGNGFTIDGGKGRIFNVSHSNVVLTNIKFHSYSLSSDPRGGAIYWVGSNGVIRDCIFDVCSIQASKSTYGGAVYWAGYNGVIRNCSFVDCFDSSSLSSSSSNGGAVYWNGAKGKLIDCNFRHCHGSYEGTSSYGGAVYWDGADGVVSGCSFSNCYVSTSTKPSFLSGGAVFWNSTRGTLFNCNFVNCYASSSNSNSNKNIRGGAIYWYGSKGIMKECSFVNCFVSSSSYYSTSDGGAVYWVGSNGALNCCSFLNCSASDGGAVYWADSNGALSNCSFRDCSAKYDGGAVYWFGLTGILSNCSFVDSHVLISNSSSSNECTSGSAVYWAGSSGVLKNCSFMNCYALNSNSVTNSYSNKVYSSSYGGAVYWSGRDGTLRDCSFVNCYATALSISLSYYSCSFGGAIYWDGYNGVLSDCNFQECFASSSYEYSTSDSGSRGGAIYWNGNTGTLRDCSFVDCYATSPHSSSYRYPDGGAVYWKGNRGTLNNCSFIDSNLPSSYYSYSNGGAVYWDGAKGTLSDCSFRDCSATNGGAVYWNGDEGALIGCSFRNCSATKDGVVNWNGNDGIVSCCSFKDCSAKLDGGAISFNTWNNNCTLFNSSFLNCTASNGGAVYVDCSNGVMRNSSFVDCSATNGGAVYWNGFLGTLGDSVFVDCSAADGGAVYWDDEDGVLCECRFINCFDNNNNAIKGINATNCKFGKNPFISVSQLTIKYGQNASIVVNLERDVPGNVKFNINGLTGKSPILNGVAIYPVPVLKYGLYNVDISYGGNYKYSADTITTTIKVNKNSPIVSIIDNKNATVTVNLAKNVPGNVKITVNNITQKAKIIDNVASATFAGLKRGTYNVEVSYAGNVNYVAQTKTATMTIAKGIPIISVDAPDITFGENAVITVNLGTDVPGNAHITVNGKTEKAKITNGKATYMVPVLKAGSYEVTVSYAGNVNYNPQTVKTTLNVAKADPITSVSVKNIKVGNDAVVNVKLASNVNGFVKITVNGVTQRVQIVNGQANATFSGLKAGTYEVSAVYAGTANFNAQTKTTSLSVTKNAAALRGYKSIVDGKVVIKATIASDAPGNVKLIVGGTTYVAKITNGVAIFNPLDIPSGTVVQLTYGGNYKYTAQTKTLTI